MRKEVNNTKVYKQIKKKAFPLSPTCFDIREHAISRTWCNKPINNAKSNTLVGKAPWPSPLTTSESCRGLTTCRRPDLGRSGDYVVFVLKVRDHIQCS
jgi:hypothetical protein